MIIENTGTFKINLIFYVLFLSTSALNNNILFYIISQTSISYTNFDMGIFLNASKLLDGGDRFSINFILPNSLFFIFYYYFINEDFFKITNKYF